VKFSEIANRLTGISTPLGGVSWQAPELEVSAARRLIAFLEDRRVLYAPDSWEVPSHCVHSVLEIRHFLTAELGKLDGKAELSASLRAMRARLAGSFSTVLVVGMAATLLATPTTTTIGQVGHFTVPSARCAEPSASTWRGSSRSSAWISKINSRRFFRLRTRRIPSEPVSVVYFFL
jgi:hypothetical protein